MGGEPLIAYRVLLKTIDYIITLSQKDNSKPSFFLFTNATKLTLKKIKELDERRVRVIVSLDGQASSNDIFRKFANKRGGSVFNVAMERLRSLPQEYLKKLEVNMVINPRTCRDLFDNVIFFYKEGFPSISPTATAYGKWSPEDFNALEFQLRKLANFYIALFQKQQPLFKIPFIGAIIKGFCEQMLSCRRVTLGADAKFYFCDAFLGGPKDKRYKYNIAGVEDATMGRLSNWITRCKQKTVTELKEISPKLSFKLHEKNLALHCPFGIYHYAKVNGYDPRPFMKDFYKVSEIFTSIFWWVKEELRQDKQFQKMYADNQAN